MNARTKVGRQLLRLHKVVRASARDEASGILACELFNSGMNGLDEKAGMTDDGVRYTAKDKLIEAVERVAKMRR